MGKKASGPWIGEGSILHETCSCPPDSRLLLDARGFSGDQAFAYSIILLCYCLEAPTLAACWHFAPRLALPLAVPGTLLGGRRTWYIRRLAGDDTNGFGWHSSPPPALSVVKPCQGRDSDGADGGRDFPRPFVLSGKTKPTRNGGQGDLLGRVPAGPSAAGPTPATDQGRTAGAQARARGRPGKISGPRSKNGVQRPS